MHNYRKRIREEGQEEVEREQIRHQKRTAEISEERKNIISENKKRNAIQLKDCHVYLEHVRIKKEETINNEKLKKGIDFSFI